MTKDQAEQIARIIKDIFQHEEQIDPRTVALVFEYISRLSYAAVLSDDPATCQHESDGQLYPAQLVLKLRASDLSAYNLPNEHLQKCSKCGEFYK